MVLQIFHNIRPQQDQEVVYNYLLVNERWMGMESLGELDLHEFLGGQKQFETYGREIKKLVSPLGKVVVSPDTLIKEQRGGRSIEMTNLQMKKYNLDGKRINLSLRKDKDFGPNIQAEIERNGKKEEIGTLVAINGGYVWINFAQAALAGYGWAEKNTYGQMLEPQVYISEQEVRKDGSISVLNQRGEKRDIRGLEKLKGSKVAMVPQHNSRWGWIIKVHALGEYKKNQNRSPDEILARTDQMQGYRKIEKDIITAEEREHFSEIMENFGQENLLSPDGEVRVVDLGYLAQKFRQQAEGEGIPLGGMEKASLSELAGLLQDWFKQGKRRISSGTKKGRRRQKPSGSKLKNRQPQGERKAKEKYSYELGDPEWFEEKDLMARIHKRIGARREGVSEEEALEEILNTLKDQIEALKVEINDESAYDKKLIVYEKVYKHFRSLVGKKGIPGMKHDIIGSDGKEKIFKLYQVEDAEVMSQRESTLLANGTGVGKTATTIAAALLMERVDPLRANKTFILAPKSAVHVWEREIIDWTEGNLNVFIMKKRDGTGTLYQKQETEDGSLETIKTDQYTIKELMKKYEKNPEKMPFVIATYSLFPGSMSKKSKAYKAIKSKLRKGEKIKMSYDLSLDEKVNEIALQMEEQYQDDVNTNEAIKKYLMQSWGVFYRSLAFQPDIFISDEGHRIKNPGTLRFKALSGLTRLLKKIPRKILVSATPLKGRKVAGMFALLNWLDPERFPDRKIFDQKYGKDLAGHMALHLELAQHLLIRREKTDVLGNKLGEIEHQMRNLVPSEEQRREYEKIAKYFNQWREEYYEKYEKEPPQENILNGIRAMMAVLAGLRPQEKGKKRYRLDTNERTNIKLREMSKILKKSREDPAIGKKKNKILVFTKYLDVAEGLYDYYKDKYNVIMVTGKKTKPFKTREECIDAVQNDEKQDMIIMTYGTGSESITLTEVTEVVFWEPDWDTPEQAESRAHRLGQEEKVTATYLMGRMPINRQRFEEEGLELDDISEVLQEYVSPERFLNLNFKGWSDDDQRILLKKGYTIEDIKKAEKVVLSFLTVDDDAYRIQQRKQALFDVVIRGKVRVDLDSGKEQELAEFLDRIKGIQQQEVDEIDQEEQKAVEDMVAGIGKRVEEEQLGENQEDQINGEESEVIEDGAMMVEDYGGINFNLDQIEMKRISTNPDRRPSLLKSRRITSVKIHGLAIRSIELKPVPNLIPYFMGVPMTN